MTDSFSALHPALTFCYFAAVLLLTMFVLHPVFLALSLLGALGYCAQLRGWRSLWRTLGRLVPFLVLMAALNALFNHAGVTMLFYLPNGNPVTREALCYGAAAAAMFAAVILWFQCCSTVMTADKYLYVFGSVLPSVSLLLSMALRFVPKFTAHMRAVAAAQASLGCGTREGGAWQRLRSGARVLSVTVSWALESGIPARRRAQRRACARACGRVRGHRPRRVVCALLPVDAHRQRRRARRGVRGVLCAAVLFAAAARWKGGADMASFALEHLTFSYPGQTRPALDDLTLTIPEGAVTVLCGESGSGKSTLLRQLKTCLTPHGETGGTVRFGDALLKDIPFAEQARRIGFVLQHPDDQIVTDKVFHELAFGLESLGCDEAAMRLRVAEMASYFGIADWFERDVHTLSGGQKQMLNLASVVVMRPDVLILDEPTSQLDPIAASTFLHTLRKLNEELGLTILLSEQRLEEAVPLADHLIVLEQGRLLAAGAPQEAAAAVRGHAIFSPRPMPDASPVPMDTPPVLTVRDGWFRYAQNAPDVLRGFSLTLRPGELYALTGSNGGGKTTALGVLAGQLRLYRGSVYLDGKKQRALQPLRDGIAAVPQDPRTLFTADTVRADLASLGRDAALLDAVVQQMALAPLLERHPFDLSGGEQQRAALAKVLLMQPRVLLLDEPTKGMDGAFKAEFGALLRTLCAQGTAVCIVSHDVEFCAQYADRCGLLFRGEVVTENDPRAFFSGNYFYTTAAARIARTAAPGAVLCEEVVQCLTD